MARRHGRLAGVGRLASKLRNAHGPVFGASQLDDEHIVGIGMWSQRAAASLGADVEVHRGLQAQSAHHRILQVLESWELCQKNVRPQLFKAGDQASAVGERGIDFLLQLRLGNGAGRGQFEWDASLFLDLIGKRKGGKKERGKKGKAGKRREVLESEEVGFLGGEEEKKKGGVWEVEKSVFFDARKVELDC